MTMYACFIGYIVQAIVNNFVPLLFVTFQTDFQIPLSQITMLITVNFMIQLLIDLLSAAGDLGCSGGPTLVGLVSSRFGDNLKMGILAAILFPVLMLIGLRLLKKK